MFCPSHTTKLFKLLVDVTGKGLQLTTVLAEGNDLLVRLFNAEGDGKPKKIMIGGKATAIELVELNGVVKETMKPQTNKSATVLTLAMPCFGLRTIRLRNFRAD